MSSPRVSVLIPAHNEAHSLPQLFAALAAQTLPADEFEVFLLNDRSSDATVALAEGYAAPFSLTVVSLDFGRPAPVRNHGASLARAPVLVFLDADCEPRPDFLARGLALAAPGTLWGADYLMPPASPGYNHTWAAFVDASHEGTTGFLPGGDLWIHTADFSRLGGFPAELETSEDVELCHRARAAGMQVLAYPALAVFHNGTPHTLARFFRQNRWHGKSVARAFLARPSLRIGILLALCICTAVGLLLLPVAVLLTVHEARHSLWLAVSLGFLLIPPWLAASARAWKRRRLRGLPVLAGLYLIYLLARASALFSRPARGART